MLIRNIQTDSVFETELVFHLGRLFIAMRLSQKVHWVIFGDCPLWGDGYRPQKKHRVQMNPVLSLTVSLLSPLPVNGRGLHWLQAGPQLHGQVLEFSAARRFCGVS